MFVALRLLTALLGITQAGSTIFPTGVVYSNWSDESEEAKVCEIILDVSNPPSREVVKFIALAGYNKFDGTVLAGFLMAAADLTADSKYQIVRISDAAFSARTFSSLGHLDYEVYDDGTVMATTRDSRLAMAFINAFFSGTYELRFARSDSDTELRTYKIASAPGEPVVGNFTHCLDHLAIESKRLRSCASTKGSPLPERGAAGSASRRVREDSPSLTHVRGGHGQTTRRNIFLQIKIDKSVFRGAARRSFRLIAMPRSPGMATPG